MLKKKIVISFIITVIYIMICLPSFATTTGKITGQTVKLREGASLDAKLVMLLSIDNKVEVISKEGDWYKVAYEDKTGYVFKDYIEVDEELEDDADATIETSNEPEDNTVANSNEENNTTNIDTNVDETNNEEDEFIVPSQMKILKITKVRILPLINASVLTNIEKDQVVTVTDYINGWIYIVSEDISGWIRKEDVVDHSVPTQTTPVDEVPVVNDDTEESNKPEQQTNTKGYVNVDSVNLRKDANTTSEVLSSIKKNTEVTIISKDSEWSKVQVNGKTGYIASKYLSDKKVEEMTNRSSEAPRTDEKEESNIEKDKTNNTNNNSNTSKGTEIVAFANKYLGVPYKSGGQTPSGFDCSGFTYYVFKNFEYTLSRSSSAQAGNGTEVAKSNLQLGDLVFFSQGSKTIGHVGIYIGGNKFIHASSPGDVVKITSLSESYYQTRYVTARRVIK